MTKPFDLKTHEISQTCCIFHTLAVLSEWHRWSLSMCDKIHVTWNGLFWLFFSVQLCGINHIHVAVQPAPPSISRTPSSSCQNESLRSQNGISPSPLLQRLVCTGLLPVSMNWLFWVPWVSGACVPVFLCLPHFSRRDVLKAHPHGSGCQHSLPF